MTTANHVALSFLPVKAHDFTFSVFRREVTEQEENPKGTRRLPEDCLGDLEIRQPRNRYYISFTQKVDFESVGVKAWTNIGLTSEVLLRALQARIEQSGLSDSIEYSQRKYVSELGLVLQSHGDVREVMWLRPYGLRSIGRFGFLCRFALRVPEDSDVSARERLELSLTHKNGRINEDFYLDQYQKLEDFLKQYFAAIQSLVLHDGSELELEHRLPAVSAFTLSRRTYVFGGERKGMSPFFGLRDYGPLQSARGDVRLVFLFAKEDRPKSQDLFRALRGDTYSTFPGMQRMFGVPIGKENVSGLEVGGFDNQALSEACEVLKATYPKERVLPVVLVPMSKHTSDEETRAYYAAKHAFLANGLASQFIDRKRLTDRTALKWSISNIGLGLFAKMGGVPWRVEPSTERCLVVGIGQAHRIVERSVERYIAYSVLSDSSGIYDAIRVLGNSTRLEDYIASLKTNLHQVLLEHGKQYKSFVLHVTYSMKRAEIDAIRGLLKELKEGDATGSEFVAIKFNDHNDFFGFSYEHNSRIPFEGTVASLSKHEALVWFSGVGLSDSKVPKMPERPVHLRILYPDEPMPSADIRRLIQDAMNIAGANWRGFNAKSMPISVYYAKLIADYYSHFRAQGLSEVDLDTISPWFL